MNLCNYEQEEVLNSLAKLLTANMQAKCKVRNEPQAFIHWFVCWCLYFEETAGLHDSD